MLPGPRVVDGVAAVVGGRADVDVVGIPLSLRIHSLVPAVVHVVLLVIVGRDVVVHHAGHLRVGTSPLLIVGLIEIVRSLIIPVCVSPSEVVRSLIIPECISLNEAIRSLIVPVCISLREKLRVPLPCKTRHSSRHVIPRQSIPALTDASR